MANKAAETAMTKQSSPVMATPFLMNTLQVQLSADPSAVRSISFLPAV